MKRPTLAEIAKVAYVSTSTVSRVLRNQPGPHPQTRQQVLIAARALGHPGIPEGFVGLIIPDRANPYFVDLGLTFQDRLDQLNLQVVIASSDAVETRELELINRFMGIGLQGVIYVASGEPEPAVLEALDRAHIPVVLFDRRVPARRHDAVSIDNLDGARRAVDYLRAMGHTQIGHLSGLSGTRTAVERSEGVRDALERHHLAWRPEWVWEGDYQAGGGVRCAEHLLYDSGAKPTAIVCANDLMAIGLIARLQEAGWDLPAQLSVVGFDNISFGRWTTPALTTVDQRVDKLVDAAVALLTERMRAASETGPPPEEPRHIEIAPRLIPRQSVAQLTPTSRQQSPERTGSTK